MFPDSLYSHELSVALHAAVEAAHFTERVRLAKGNVPDAKADSSPVTIGDLGAQAIICKHLRAAFTNDAIVGEESAISLSNSILEHQGLLSSYFTTMEEFRAALGHGSGVPGKRFWTVDPIDGTAGFIRDEQYSIAVALLIDYQVVVSVLICPPYGKTFGDYATPNTAYFAVKGGGTYRSSLENPQSATRVFASVKEPIRLIELGNWDHPSLHKEALTAVCGRIDESYSFDGQVKYAVIANGDATAFLRIPRDLSNPSVRYIWDHTAGSLLVEESGGFVSDVYGKRLDFSAGTTLENNVGLVVAANPVHSQLLEWFDANLLGRKGAN